MDFLNFLNQHPQAGDALTTLITQKKVSFESERLSQGEKPDPEETKRVVIDQTEQILLDIKNGINKHQRLDPLLNFGLDLIIPYLTEAYEYVRELVEDIFGLQDNSDMESDTQHGSN